MPRGQGDSALYTHADDEDDHDQDDDGDEHDEDDEINDDASGTGHWQYTCMG